jgi:hypothetical protein
VCLSCSRLSSISTRSICCGFAVQQVVQQINNKSTSNLQLFDKITTFRHVEMLWICCGVNNKSTTNRNNGVWLSTCPQQVEKLYNKSTALRQVVQPDAQQIHNKSNKWSLSSIVGFHRTLLLVYSQGIIQDPLRR